MKTLLKFFISFGISCLIIAYLLNYTEIDEILALLRQVDTQLLILCFAIYLSFTVLRSARIKVLLNETVMLTEIMPVLLTHNLINFLIPFRLGELSYVFLMKRVKGVPTAMGLASLAYIRALDIMFLFGLFGLSSLFVRNFTGLPFEINKVGALLAVLVISFTIALLYYSGIFRSRLENLSARLSERFTLKRCIDNLIKVLDTLQSYKSAKISIQASFLTFLIWLLIFGFYYFLVRSIGTRLSFSEFSLCILLINLTGLLPIQGIAGFGTFEAAVILGLTSFGIPFSNAVSLGFSLHILYLIYFILFGLVGLIFTAHAAK